MGDEDYDQLELRQRLKAAIHYTVGRICEETGQEMNVRYSRQFVAALSEATDKFCQRLSVDLELFSKHAKRSTITADDVKLCVRRNPDLYQHIEQLEERQADGRKQKKKKTDTKKKASKQSDGAIAADNGDTMDVTDETSNM